jgi:hypothetical protein
MHSASVFNNQFLVEIVPACGGLLLFDTLIFALTVYKSWTFRAEKRASILRLMCRDGK